MKNSQYTTGKKKDFSFYSPERSQPTAHKPYVTHTSPQFEHQNLRQRFKQLQKQNRNPSKFRESLRGQKMLSNEQFQLISQQHMIEIEKLLLEISRLHDLCYDIDKTRILEVQKVKDEYEQQVFYQISSIKQSHIGKIQTLELQIKKGKQLLELKNDQYRQLQKNSIRDKDNFIAQNDRLKNQIKTLIGKKNDEIYTLKTQNEKQIQKILKDNEDRFEDLKQQFNQEVDRVKKTLIQKTRSFQRIQNQKNKNQNQTSKVVQSLEEQMVSLEQKLAQNALKANKRIQSQRQRLQDIFNDQISYSEKAANLRIQMYQKENERLLQAIHLKQQQIKNLSNIYEVGTAAHNLQLQRYQDENRDLKDKLKYVHEQNLKELELLKVKMAILHETDLKQLVALYETKIEGVSAEVKRAEQQASRARAFLQQQIHKKYQMKKKYDLAISRLNAKVMQLRTGMNTMETELKDKIDQQRSLMLMTSRSFIKQTQLKNNNVKFYEQELRKLRQLLDVQTMQAAVSEKNVQEKIKIAQQQLTRLSSKIVKIKSQNQQIEDRLKGIIDSKDNQIKELNQMLIDKKKMEVQEANTEKDRQISALNNQVAEKDQKINNLSNKNEQLDRNLTYVKTQLEQLRIDTQISQQQSKQRYTKISEQMLRQMKNFYQRKIKEQEEDKQSLKKLNSSQMQKITELIQKYNQLEQGLKDMLRQSKKLSQLQNKIIHLGSDNNLVKNMAQLFKS